MSNRKKKTEESLPTPSAWSLDHKLKLLQIIVTVGVACSAWFFFDTQLEETKTLLKRGDLLYKFKLEALIEVLGQADAVLSNKKFDEREDLPDKQPQDTKAVRHAANMLSVLCNSTAAFEHYMDVLLSEHPIGAMSKLREAIRQELGLPTMPQKNVPTNTWVYTLKPRN
jgi:hypothetical protein